jgi:hypothetical protein
MVKAQDVSSSLPTHAMVLQRRQAAACDRHYKQRRQLHACAYLAYMQPSSRPRPALSCACAACRMRGATGRTALKVRAVAAAEPGTDVLVKRFTLPKNATITVRRDHACVWHLVVAHAAEALPRLASRRILTVRRRKCR